MQVKVKVPHWAQFGGPFCNIYSRGRWFVYAHPQYGEGWKWGLGHRMGGFWLAEIGPLRLGRTS